MPVLSAREHAATEAHARGGVDVPGRSPTGFANTDCEAHAPVLTSEWAASFMHGFNEPRFCACEQLAPHRVFTIVVRTRPRALRTKHTS